jgi:hypothetical protein
MSFEDQVRVRNIEKRIGRRGRKKQRHNTKAPKSTEQEVFASCLLRIPEIEHAGSILLAPGLWWLCDRLQGPGRTIYVTSQQGTLINRHGSFHERAAARKAHESSFYVLDEALKYPDVIIASADAWNIKGWAYTASEDQYWLFDALRNTGMIHAGTYRVILSTEEGRQGGPVYGCFCRPHYVVTEATIHELEWK